MGVGRIFSRGAKNGEFRFLSLEIKKQLFFANNFKIQGGQGPPDPPSDAHDCDLNSWHNRPPDFAAATYFDQVN